ncbi:AAA family ATPase, partial [Candidatus Entotheonella serta]
MQERRVTVMGETHPLPMPFFVLATQNPIELEGTYPLPEAQLDRFFFKLEVERGGHDVLERMITDRQMGDEPQVAQVLTHDTLMQLMHLRRRVYLPEVVANYIAQLVDATHPGSSVVSQGVKFGASPRAALALASAVRARALIEGRINASFEDVEATAQPVLQHRLVLDYSARLQGTRSVEIVRDLLHDIPKQPRPAAAVLDSTPIS